MKKQFFLECHCLGAAVTPSIAVSIHGGKTSIHCDGSGGGSPNIVKTFNPRAFSLLP